MFYSLFLFYAICCGCKPLHVYKTKIPKHLLQDFLRCVRDFNLHNQEISQSFNMLIIIKLLQINYITKYH